MTKTKKLIPVLFALLACLVLFAASASAYTLGDVDANGKIAAADARLALRAAVQLEKFGKDTASDKFKAADVDHNGKITAADARMILRVAVKLDTFPAAPSETPTADGCTHTWVYTTNRSNKGVVTGTHTAKCSKCGQTKTENCTYGAKNYISKDESGKIITKPTCTKGTSYTQTCALCKGVKASAGEPALNHKNKVRVANKSKVPTCTEAGWNFFSCPDCKLDGSTTDKKAKAILYVPLDALGHDVDAKKLSANTDIVCFRCKKTIMPSFNSLVNEIKKMQGSISYSGISSNQITGDVKNHTIKFSTWAKGLMAAAGESMTEDDILNELKSELLKSDPTYSNYVLNRGYLNYAYPIPGSEDVSRLKDSDLKSINVKEINSIDFIKDIPDTVGSNKVSLAALKAQGNTTGNIYKVSVELINEKYSDVKKLPTDQETALMRGTGFDIRTLPAEMEKENNYSEEGFDISMTCNEITSSCTITYYFLVTTEGSDTEYKPLASMYRTNYAIDETITMKAEVSLTENGKPMELMNGNITMLANDTTTDYYIFTIK